MPPRRVASDPRQTVLFGDEDGRLPDGSLQFDHEWRVSMTRAIQQAGKPREAIAAEMERLLGNDPDHPVSKATLDAMTAPSRTNWRFPVGYLPAFVRATGAIWLIDRLAGRCGRAVVTEQDARRITLGEIRAERIRLQELEKRFERELRAELRRRGGR